MNETSSNLWLPIPTCEIAPPILEEAPAEAARDSRLPRILRQLGGRDQARRRVLGLTALFAGLSLLLLALHLAFPGGRTLTVYLERPAQFLVGGRP